MQGWSEAYWAWHPDNPTGDWFGQYGFPAVPGMLEAAVTQEVRSLGLPVPWYGVYGNTVIVDHGSGISTMYAHCSRLAVSVGQTVQRGQVVGYVGSTGWSTGPHLHFGVRNYGRPINPMRF